MVGSISPHPTEREIVLPSNDGRKIYGTLRVAGSRTLAIFVHGLTGNRNEHLFFNGSRFFSAHGIDSFRFDLYTGQPDARALPQCSLETHSDDLNTVVARFQSEYERLHLIGHSLGAPTILGADTSDATTLVFWDPSNGAQYCKDSLRFDERLQLYVLEWGVEALVSKTLIDQWVPITPKAVERHRKPVKVICAGNGVLVDDWAAILGQVESKYAFHVINGASHCFDEDGAEDELFSETLRWLDM